jgi:hypothetical protein
MGETFIVFIYEFKVMLKVPCALCKVNIEQGKVLGAGKQVDDITTSHLNEIVQFQGSQTVAKT